MDDSNAAKSAVALCDEGASECPTIAPTIDCAPPTLLRPRLERLFSLERLTQSSEAWRDLCDRAGGAIEQFEWVRACLEGGSTPRILTTTINEQLTSFAPLSRTTYRGLPWLEMPGVAEHYEPMDFVARDEQSLTALCRAVAGQRLPIRLGRLPVDSPTVQALETTYAGRGFVRKSARAAAPWIALDDAWLTPESQLNSGRRSDLRRARKRAEELGPVEFQILCPEVSELPGLLDEAFAVEERSWKGTEETALARDAGRGEFFRRYAEAVCRQKTLRICFMRIGGQAVAMQIAVVQSRRLWLLKVGYDSTFSRCSPGMLLTRETIAWAASEKLLGYEFLGLCEPWTSVWTERARDCIEFTAYPYSVCGLAALSVDAGLAGFSRMRGRCKRGLGSLKTAITHAVKSIVSRAARRYIAGDTLMDAGRVRERLASKGHETTLGFWDAEGDAPRVVADRYLEAIESMRGAPRHAYVSIKLPSLQYSNELLEEVATKATEVGCRLHFDALAPESVERTQAAIDGLKKKFPDLGIGYTIPGRWRRSVADADWAATRSVAVRVVKGQFAEKDGNDVDPRQGFLDVIAKLAGRAKHVDVATHDEPLAREACALLFAAQTPFDRECLFGMIPSRSEAPPRVYIPYGAAYLPYAVARLRKNPRLAGRLLFDWMRSFFRI